MSNISKAYIYLSCVFSVKSSVMMFIPLVFVSHAVSILLQNNK